MLLVQSILPIDLSMSVPSVSVVMSAYNGECFLREAVESILDQSFRDFEFIVINDGSTDGSAAMLDSYQRNDPRVRVYHQENSGLVESLNRGCKLARGKYIARMDADDIALRNRLMYQVEFMEKHPEVGVVGGAIEVINASGKSLQPDRHPCEDHEINQALLRGDTPLVHPTVLMRKDALVSVGGYRKVVLDSEDYDLWLRIADHWKLANLDVPVLKYRRHLGQVSVRKFKQEALSNLAARAAAVSRRSGKPDLLDSVEDITPKVFAELGVSESLQVAAVARGYLICAGSMCDSAEYSFASGLLDEMLHFFDWRLVGKHIVSDFRLLRARIYWSQRRFGRSILTVSHAVLARPVILGRPLKPLMNRIRRSMVDVRTHSLQFGRDSTKLN